MSFIHTYVCSYSGFLLKLCKQNDLDGVDKVLATIQDKGIQLDPTSYLSLFGHMCKIGDDVRIRKLQTTMLSHRVQLDTRATLALYSYYISHSKFEAAVYLIRKPPRGVTYTDKDSFDMLETATRESTPMECVQIFDLMYQSRVPVTPAARHLVLEHCVKLREWPACERMLTLLLEIPHIPNNTFILALRALARARQEQLVIRIIELMRKHNRAAMYGPIMDAVRGHEHVAVLHALQRDMKDKRIQPDKEVLEIMISSAASRKRPGSVIFWFNIMRNLGIKLGPATHKEVVEAYGHFRSPEKEFFELIEEGSSGLSTAFKLFRANKDNSSTALVFRAMCKHQLILLPSIINYFMPILLDYAQKEIMGVARGSENTEALLGKGWPEFLVEVLNMCKKDKIGLWPRVHTRVQEYVTWRTSYKPDNINKSVNSQDNSINNENNIATSINEQQKEDVQNQAGGVEQGESSSQMASQDRATERGESEEKEKRQRESNIEPDFNVQQVLISK